MERQITVRLTDELYRRIEEEQDQGAYRVPKAQVIREALQKGLNCDEGMHVRA